MITSLSSARVIPQLNQSYSYSMPFIGSIGVTKMQLESQYKKPIPEAVKQFDNYPDSAFIRPQIAKSLLGVSIATFWRLVKSGQLKTHKLTERTTTVKVADLRAFIASKVER